MFRRFTAWMSSRRAAASANVQFDRMRPSELFEESQAGKCAIPAPIVDTEREYINAYRGNTGRPAVSLSADSGGGAQPLFGLALSGGGIRSASIALGVMQAMANQAKLEKFDYLSTVSGGGYIGSALTWFTSRPWPNGSGPLVNFSTGNGSTATPEFPYGTRPPAKPPTDPNSVVERVLRFLKQHANYLEPVKGINLLS